MRIKKGFTLAEILIVLMVIGVIATMTIPSLMKGVAEAQYKAAYKKAYNAIANFTMAENIAGQLPKKRSAEQTTLFYGALASNLEIKEFVKSNGIDDGNFVVPSDPGIKGGFTLKSGNTEIHVGASDAKEEGIAPGLNSISTWMVTADGIAYSIMVTADDGSDCISKAEIAGKPSVEEALKAACMLVVVDVNGLYKGPNRLEIQNTQGGSSGLPDVVASGEKLKVLSRDRYYIYVGSDGAGGGPAATSVSGRILNDLK